MSMKYLFTREELSFLSHLPNMISGIFLRNEQILAAEGLIQKGYMYMDGGTMVLDPLVLVFSDVLSHPRHMTEMPDGMLYEGEEIFLWIEEDDRRLSGIILSAFPSLKVWYEEISEKKNREYTLEECRRRLEKDE